jgi:hypothetical protein
MGRCCSQVVQVLATHARVPLHASLGRSGFTPEARARNSAPFIRVYSRLKSPAGAAVLPPLHSARAAGLRISLPGAKKVD